MYVHLLALSSLAIPIAAWAASKTAETTFYKDVLPILQSKCQGCHRPGEIGPMPLTSYQEARPWAKAIREAVLLKKMPPWFADSRYGKFSNDYSLSQQERHTLTAWADGGAREGDPKQAPKPREFVQGWSISEPDLVLEMPSEFSIPANGAIDYQYIVIPTGLTEDRWVQMAEVRPSNRSVVHHSVIYIREPESKWLRGEAEPGVPFVPPRRTPEGRPRNDIGGFGSEILIIYTPGMVPDIWRPGMAKKLRAGSDLVFQMHYTTGGKAGTDRTRLGLVFSKEPPQQRVLTIAPANTAFTIPPGDPNHEVNSRSSLVNPAQLISLFPHMHLRGKAFEYRVVHPSGESQTVLKVDPYKFNWQLSYKLAEPLALPAGARIECTGWFDNSPNNPANPDPTASVRWGEQSWEEMMIGFVDVAFDAKMDRRSFFTRKKESSED